MASFGSSNKDAALCANNCGFYGSPKNQNLCSLCYAAAKVLNDDEAERPQTMSLPSVETGRISPSGPSGSVADLTKKRCKVCKKKIGMLGFNCRCGDSFCGKHRYPEEHSCDVDHKAIGRDTLAKQIVQCKADKLQFRV